MHTKTISEAEALSICVRPEDHFFDRKAAEIKGAKIQKIAVAFANADGGEFCVGVADDKDEPDVPKRWKGARSIEDFNSLIQSLVDVKPSLPMDIMFLKSPLSDGYVMYVQVDKSQYVHQTSDSKVYERNGAQSLPIADANKITALSHAKGTTSFEDVAVESAFPEDVVDSEEIRRFLSEYSSSTDPLDLALNKGLLDRKSFKPKVAGLILFANDPTSVMPKKCSVRIARYETKEDDPERDHLAFVESVEGPLYQLIHKTIARVKEIMSSIKVWTTDGPTSMDYPPETLWEIVVNALIHRDYSVSDDVQIQIFDNRIEVVSPGRLPAFVTTANILDTRFGML
ncbi:MAG TPA: RNA-binding domain-containing protein [Spongiibacteraceae bacterium]|nr:RNA-binding domain-containing protein [Spongiibacteraceae bacterium]